MRRGGEGSSREAVSWSKRRVFLEAFLQVSAPFRLWVSLSAKCAAGPYFGVFACLPGRDTGFCRNPLGKIPFIWFLMVAQARENGWRQVLTNLWTCPRDFLEFKSRGGGQDGLPRNTIMDDGSLNDAFFAPLMHSDYSSSVAQHINFIFPRNSIAKLISWARCIAITQQTLCSKPPDISP